MSYRIGGNSRIDYAVLNRSDNSESTIHDDPMIASGYKQTEVGIIPEDWEQVTVAEIAAPSRNAIVGGPFGSDLVSRDYVSRGVPVIRGQNMRALWVAGDFVFVSHQKAVALEANLARPWDIVFTQRGTLGQVSLVPDDGYGCYLVSQSQMKVTVNRRLADPLYLYYVFHSAPQQEYIRLHTIQTGLPHLNLGTLRGIPVPLPALAEQKAIAGALGDVDALIESLEQLLHKKRQIKHGAMQELLTGKTRLPGFRGEWVVKRLAEIAVPSSEKNIDADDLPVLTCSKHLGFVDSMSYFKNQIFSRDTSGYRIIRRNQIGYPSNHVEEGSIGLQDIYDCALVSPIYVVFSVIEGINSYFIHRVLKLDSYRERFHTATTASVDRRGSLRWPAFSQIAVCLPPLPEQNAIAAILSDMEAGIAALEGKLAKTREIKQGMMQELLTGRIRLV